MKTIRVSIALLLLALGCRSLEAATNVVILGDSFQAKIDVAAPGDTLVVQGGTFSGNINFTKPLTVVASGTNMVQFPGTVSIQAAGTVNACRVVFLGPLQVSSNATLMLSRCTISSTFTSSGGIIQAYDNQFAGVVTATGGSFLVKRCNFASDVILTNTSLEALRMTNWNLTATASGPAPKMIMSQCVPQGPLTVTGYKTWLGYCTGFRFALYNCDAVMVGCHLYHPQGDFWAALYVHGGRIVAYNNRLRREIYGLNGGGPWAVQLEDTDAKFVNCSILSYAAAASFFVGTVGPFYYDVYPNGILVNGPNSTATFRNCALMVFWGPRNGGSTGFACDAGQIKELDYCCIYATSPLNGVSSATSIFTDPLFNPDLTLSGASPCINTGDPGGIHKDSDGTRNDIGATGGTLWNPGNYTNSNPIVFWLMPTNQTVLKGLQTTIPINAAATAGH